jgi:hypothetical protein
LSARSGYAPSAAILMTLLCLFAGFALTNYGNWHWTQQGNKMSKKDYMKLADLVRKYKEVLEKNDLFEPFVDDLTDILWKDNPRFSYKQFVDYINRTK